jgi:hypothetical protein
MITVDLIERAGEIGREHRAGYEQEFGEGPTRETCGDWDATGWSECLATLIAEFDVNPKDDEVYDDLCGAYHRALFAEKRAAGGDA